MKMEKLLNYEQFSQDYALNVKEIHARLQSLHECADYDEDDEFMEVMKSFSVGEMAAYSTAKLLLQTQNKVLSLPEISSLVFHINRAGFAKN